MRRERTFLVLTVALGVALALVAGELAVRVFRLSKTMEMRTAASRLPRRVGGPIGARYEPSQQWVGAYGARYRSNRLGYRDRNHDIDKATGVIRIAVLGDSVAEGLGVEENQRFSTRLEILLNRNAARRHEVLNFAIGGAATLDELEILRRDVLQFSPDMILVQVCSNDIVENNAKAIAVVGAPPPPRGRADWRSLLRKHSGLYLFLAERYNDLRLRYGRSTRVLDSLLALKNDDFTLTARTLDDIARHASAAGASTRVVYPPSAAEARIADDTLAQHFETLLQAVLRPHSLFSVLKDVRGASGCEAFMDDVHLSPCGHAIVAAALYRQLAAPERE